MKIYSYSFGILPIILCFALSICFACSHSNYTTQIISTNNHQVIVVGRIKDKSNTPLAAVQISTKDKLKSTSSDREGNYKLKLSKGHHKLKAIWIGYFHIYTKTLNLKEGDSVIINFKMKADLRPLID